jgi:uncharacterized membrane protein YgcG
MADSIYDKALAVMNEAMVRGGTISSSGPSSSASSIESAMREAAEGLGAGGAATLTEVEDLIELMDRRMMAALQMSEYEQFMAAQKAAATAKAREAELARNYIYPSLDDPLFPEKTAQKEEFRQARQREQSADEYVETAESSCDRAFELAPHQRFVRDFMSSDTPYNSLLLFHGLGTGKTCSAIGVCEEMRRHIQQFGLRKKIMVIASPNVQENFKLQLFDERKLVQKNGYWNIQSCAGRNFIQDILPLGSKNVPRRVIVAEAKRIIRENYAFMGYIEFSNRIAKLMERQQDGDLTEEQKRQLLDREFSNRLLVIDEVHNIRITGDVKSKKVTSNLLSVVRNATNLKLLLLSATPMFNDIREVVWLMNLLNANDGRAMYSAKDLFTRDGFLKEETAVHPRMRESALELLRRKLTGYVSFVRGENPFSFPLRIYPSLFDKKRTTFAAKFTYPKVQLNGTRIREGLKYSDLFLSPLGEVQRRGYELLCDQLVKKLPEGEDLERGIGWQTVDPLLQALNIVYPTPATASSSSSSSSSSGSSSSDSSSSSGSSGSSGSSSGSSDSAPARVADRSFIGTEGLQSVMSYTASNYRGFSYRSDTPERIFQQPALKKYSYKIHAILERIKRSTGVCIVYSQYIGGGCVPMALALEEAGFRRTEGNKSLFTEYNKAGGGGRDNLMDVNTMKTYAECSKDERKNFRQARYAMITGNGGLTPNSVKELKKATQDSNAEGGDVKVIIISRAGSEGIDFKYVRQMHVMEPWYNMGRIEQIIGRAIRFCSHAALPLEQRNCEVYMHATKPRGDWEELDMYIYRVAERKAVEVGKVTRMLKEISVDCYLNHPSSVQGVDIRDVDAQLRKAKGVGIQISTRGKRLKVPTASDKPYPAYSTLCDYMENCEYTCSLNSKRLYSEAGDGDPDELNSTTMTRGVILKQLRSIIDAITARMAQQYVFRMDDLYERINATHTHSRNTFYTALAIMGGSSVFQVTDRAGRAGVVMFNREVVWFQPNDLESAAPAFDAGEMRRPLPQFAERQVIRDVPRVVDQGSLFNRKQGAAQEKMAEAMLGDMRPYAEAKKVADEYRPEENVRQNALFRMGILPSELIGAIEATPVDQRAEKWGAACVLHCLTALVEYLYDNRGEPTPYKDVVRKGDRYMYKYKEFTELRDLVYANQKPKQLLLNLDIMHVYQSSLLGSHKGTLQSLIGLHTPWYEGLLQLGSFNPDSRTDFKTAGMRKLAKLKWPGGKLGAGGVFSREAVLRYTACAFFDMLPAEYKKYLIQQLHERNADSVFNRADLSAHMGGAATVAEALRDYIAAHISLGEYAVASAPVEGYVLRSGTAVDLFVMAPDAGFTFSPASAAQQSVFGPRMEARAAAFAAFAKAGRMVGFTGYNSAKGVFSFKIKDTGQPRDTGAEARTKKIKDLVPIVNGVRRLVEAGAAEYPTDIKTIGKSRATVCMELEFMLRHLGEKERAAPETWFIPPEHVPATGVEKRRVKIGGGGAKAK